MNISLMPKSLIVALDNPPSCSFLPPLDHHPSHRRQLLTLLPVQVDLHILEFCIEEIVQKICTLFSVFTIFTQHNYFQAHSHCCTFISSPCGVELCDTTVCGPIHLLTDICTASRFWLSQIKLR